MGAAAAGAGMEREEEEKTGAAAPEDAAGEWRSGEVRSEMSDGRSGSAWDRVMAGSARRGVELEGGISSAGSEGRRRRGFVAAREWIWNQTRRRVVGRL